MEEEGWLETRDKNSHIHRSETGVKDELYEEQNWEYYG